MSNVFIGQILMFAGNFAPRGFALCNGQTLPIAQNQALFALIGTTYGGDGRTNFQLPNLQCNLPMHAGQGPGLSNYNLGQVGGAPSVTLTTPMMAGHTHVLSASQGPADNVAPGSGVLPATATGAANVRFYAAQQQGGPQLTPVAMAASACGPAGGNAAHSNLMPSLCITFVIALQGHFPSRN